jgi:maltose alpha-D-glucosyltransferase/alpha-amylase
MTRDDSLRTSPNPDDTRLREWLESRRWFADKGRGIADVVVSDMMLAPSDDHVAAIAIAEVTFADGVTARYLLTIANPNPAFANSIPLSGQVLEPDFGEAAETGSFGHWLIDQFIAERRSGERKWTFATAPGSDLPLRIARQSPAMLMRAEQSNTSLRFGDVVIIKLIRRLQPGPNPDAEVLRALAGVGFAHVPRFLGEASWTAGDGVTYPVALVQAYVPNDGDGWSWTLQRLTAIAAGEAEADLDMTAERLLGQRTGELHAALSQIAAPDFAPVSASEEVVAQEIARMERAADEVLSLLAAAGEDVANRLPAPMLEIAASLRSVASRAEGLRDEVGLPRIRVHGDFHLGQTLRRPDGDWTIIDFEGEPARPVAERRQKSSPLKDVAGMLRSFAYARHATERGMSDLTPRQRERLARWEWEARRAYLAEYRTAVGAAPVPLVPGEDASFTRALAAWELDKALYEIAYEARNRPDWIDLPLRALLPDDDQAGTTGGAPA